MHHHRRQFNTLGIAAGLWVILPAQALSLNDLSISDASAGLKLALEKGADTAIQMLGVQNGFMGNDQVRIGLPSGLDKGAKLLKTMGMGKHIEELTLQMNRAAEAAVPMSRKLITQSIHNMSVKDAKGILQGGENSVTQFFADKTRAPLTSEFMPTVRDTLSQLGVVEQFNAIAGKLAGMGLMAKEKANLESHVTDKTLSGLYFMIGEQEKRIRQNPAEAGSALLTKVFGALH